MPEIKIHMFHTGKVCVAPELPFGGERCSTLKASGVFAKKSAQLWLPVSAYLIECPHGKLLFDCGWHRDMSPGGVFDKRAQIKSLGSLPLYITNQGVVEKGAAIDERLADVSARRGLIPPALPMIRLRRRSRLSGYARRALMQTASSRLQTMTLTYGCTQLNYEKRPSDTCVSGGQIFDYAFFLTGKQTSVTNSSGFCVSCGET